MSLSPRRLQAYGWLILNTLAWGATIPVVKWGLGNTTPFRFLLYRFAIATLISLPIFFSYRKLICRKAGLFLKVMGLELIGTTLALSLLYLGLARTTALEASLISTTGPVFITLGGLLFLRERVTKREWTGLSIATGTTIALTLIPLFWLKDGLLHANFLGNFLVLLQNFVNVAYLLLAKRVYHHLPKILIGCISVAVGFVSFLILSLAETFGNVHLLSQVIARDLSVPSVWIIALFAAVITSFVGLTTYLKGQDLIEASEASLFNYLQPLVYIPLSLLLLNEHTHPLQLLCFVVVIIGVGIAEWKPKRVRRLRKSKM